MFARAKEALPGDLDLTQRMLGGLDRLLQITRSLMCLPNWELGTLEGSNRCFEGFGKLQNLLVGLLLKVDGPTKALADVVTRLVIDLANVAFRIKILAPPRCTRQQLGNISLARS